MLKVLLIRGFGREGCPGPGRKKEGACGKGVDEAMQEGMIGVHVVMSQDNEQNAYAFGNIYVADAGFHCFGELGVAKGFKPAL